MQTGNSRPFGHLSYKRHLVASFSLFAAKEDSWSPLSELRVSVTVNHRVGNTAARFILSPTKQASAHAASGKLRLFQPVTVQNRRLSPKAVRSLAANQPLRPSPCQLIFLLSSHRGIWKISNSEIYKEWGPESDMAFPETRPGKPRFWVDGLAKW